MKNTLINGSLNLLNNIFDTEEPLTVKELKIIALIALVAGAAIFKLLQINISITNTIIH
ncbi:hypothetical protein KNP65_03705 [Latilactobacillus curvatus]|uniref:hypothetical protein n=1 Tax=Latilactobacillus TaxID=2767885 RepID=UPI000A883EBB|nr:MULTISPECIES: hypothetical protein [Latilactobacillus]MDG2979043.1 hypothetical protein [Latilactobacillus curvatus]